MAVTPFIWLIERKNKSKSLEISRRRTDELTWYQAKGLFAEYGLPVSEGYAVDTAEEAVEDAKKIGGDRWVVKVQVHAEGEAKQAGSS